MRSKPQPWFQVRNRTLLLADLVLIIASVLASFALRLDLGPIFIAYLPAASVMVAVALLIKPFVYHLFGLYRRYWVYASTREMLTIALATLTASGAVAVGIMIVILLGGLRGFPRSVLLIDWLLSLISVGGLRLSVRLLAEGGQISQKADGLAGKRRVVVVGGGDAGVLVVREMQRNPQLHMLPIAFVDDDPDKQKASIHGVKVAGTLRDLASVVDRYFAHEVVIAIPSAPGDVLRQVTTICQQRGIPYRTMPGMYELIGGKVSVSRLREVDISDLLRREPARIDDQAVGATLAGRRVLVTGAGGSIGLELCRQIARWEPASLAMLGHGENSIFEGLLEIQETNPELAVRPMIADVRDLDRISGLFESYLPEVVFHAAAHKHVPLMEVNPEEAITNNIQGTRSVVQAAERFGANRLVLISTDKAVQPASLMGATKRVAEMLVRDAAIRTGRPFVTVRFGNVLGSRGSIVPIFKRQIAHGGPVTITHPDMERYFMTIPEAVHLVLQAAAYGSGGEIFVLRMGDQVKILELAQDLIRLSGLDPGKDIEIAFTGVRPGEKLSEALWDEGLRYQETPHPEIVRLDEDALLSGDGLERMVDGLLQHAHEGDAQAIIGLLEARIPGASLSEAPLRDITSVL